MNRILRPCVYIAGLLAALVCLAVVAGYIEYRTNAVAHALGDYLADTNRSRASTGRLWDLITSEDAVRRTLPDSISSTDEIPSDLPSLVRNHHLTLDRIPDEGMPGYLAILVEAIPSAERDIVDTRRLVGGSRTHKLGRRVLDQAEYDATPYLQEARKQATEMARRLDSSDPLTAREGDEPDTPAAPEGVDSLRTPEDNLRALPPDSIATSLVETFTSVILEAHLVRLKTRILTEWDDGQIQQLFLSRGLGAYEGELYYFDQTRPRVTFRIPSEEVSAILGIPIEESTP